jgi:hypothetical protein
MWWRRLRLRTLAPGSDIFGDEGRFDQLDRALRRLYWVMLIRSFLLALPFALYLFSVGPPLAVILLALGVYAARWRAAMLWFQLIVLVPSFISAVCMTLILWGENLPLGGHS